MILFARILVLACLLPYAVIAQVNVSTLVELDASGGVTLGPDGYIYVSDFGPLLGPAPDTTAVYRVHPESGNYSVFAEGFEGASGAAFDSEGNFYQAEPRGNRVTRINLDGSREIVADDFSTPVGIQIDSSGNLYICNCGAAEIVKISASGERSVLVQDADILKCPNGLSSDDQGNLYAVTFAAGNVVRISPQGEMQLIAELPMLGGGPQPVGLGHITYGNGYLYITAIGTGVIYRVSLEGEIEIIAGRPFAFSNIDGDEDIATFSKPNGIALNAAGDQLFVNVSEAAWPNDPTGLHPAKLRVISLFPDDHD